MEIINPHDKYFKEILSDLDNAADFIKGFFPEDLMSNLNIKTLEIDNNNYITEELKEYFSDVVYNCLYKSKVLIKITFLFEHKSYYDKYYELQILKYLINIWENSIKQNKKTTVVLPIIFYHGRTRWKMFKISQYFSINDSNLKKYIPEFEYVVIDLSLYSDEEIKNNLFNMVSMKISMLVMKNIFNQKILKESLADYLNIGKIYFEEEKGLNFLKSLILYLYSAGDIKVNDIVETISSISVKGGQTAMSTASKLIEQGELKGIEKGKVIKTREILIKFITTKFNNEITESDIKMINSCNDSNKLQNAIEGIISAEDKNTILEKLN